MQHTAARSLPTPMPEGLPRQADSSGSVRGLSCGAGFFADAAAAQAARDRLVRDLDLGERQVLLLKPEDAAARRFSTLSLRWRPRRQSRLAAARAGRWLQSALGAMLLGFVGTTWVVNLPDLPISVLVAAILGSIAVGAVLGWLSAWRQDRRPRKYGNGQRFDQVVQRALGDGEWAVVVHGVSLTKQPNALNLLRESSLRWCVETSGAERRG